MKIKPLSGRVFGRLTVLECVGRNNNRSTMWRCKCECGNTVDVPRTRLISGNTQSCGCIWIEKNRLSFGEASRNKVLYHYKVNAKRKNHSFNLTDEQFFGLISLDCFYCGSTPQNLFQVDGGYGEIRYNGIDRIDTSKGYEIGNVVPCCSKCNFAKRTMSYTEFKDWIHKISDHMFSKEIMFSNM